MAALLTATMAAMPVAFLRITGRFGLSWLGDSRDKRYLLAATLGITGLTMVERSVVDGLPSVIPILVAYAAVYGGSPVLPQELQAGLLGRTAFATVRGLLHTAQTGGMLLVLGVQRPRLKSRRL